MALEGGLAQPKTGPEVTLISLRQVRRFTQHHIGQVLQALSQAGRSANKARPLACAT